VGIAGQAVKTAVFPSIYQRSERGLFMSALSPLERFTAKCEFDPITGCVVWIGGRTAGHGNTAVYGSFRDGDKRWYAHRWAALHIHGLDIEGYQVGHCCPHTGGKPNTLCVQHVEPQTQLVNMQEMNSRRWVQAPEDRQYWLFVALGIEKAPEVYKAGQSGVPFFNPPAWYLEAKGQQKLLGDDCPF
jgi:hypothetical protein